MYTNDGSTVTILDSHFVSNRALTNRSEYGNTNFGGGVVYAEDDVKITITRSHFINNSAHNHGGVVWGEPFTPTISGTVNSLTMLVTLVVEL